MHSLAHELNDLMRQFSSEWDYGAGRMAFPIPALHKSMMLNITYKLSWCNLNLNTFLLHVIVMKFIVLLYCHNHHSIT